MRKQSGIAVLGALMAMAGAGSAMAQGGYETAFVPIENDRGFPVRGVSSGNVLTTHGEPAQKSGPVGNPPISAWKYDDFTVYFESDLVITTVSGEDRLPGETVDSQ